MGTITSGIGLVSGINTSSIIDQLMSLEARPKTILQGRIDTANQQKLAYTDLRTRLTSLRLFGTSSKKPSFFQNASVTSSDQNVLTGSASAGAAVGTYSFQVARLVTAQQTISNGYADYSSAKLGAGTITLEAGGGELVGQTTLASINGNAGVQRGVFRITDRSGKSSTIDISASVTLQDVVKKINTDLDVSVRAKINGNKLVLTDQSGGAGNFIVADIGDGKAAADLGIASNVAASAINGSDINYLSRNTLLSQVNDGRGIRTASGVPDFRVTFGDNSTVDVSVATAKSIGDVIDAINTAGAGKVKASLQPGANNITLTDTSGAPGSFTVSSLNSSNAAKDLGLLGTATTTLNGANILARFDGSLISSLRGGQGLNLGTVSITDRSGASANIDLTGLTDTQAILDAINTAGLGVNATLNDSGNGFQLTDTSGGTGNLIISDVSGSTASQLGLAGTFSTSTPTVNGANLQKQWITDNTLLSDLNGGNGVSKSQFKITNSAGNSVTIDLSLGNQVRLKDVISLINNRNAGVTASINANGDGLLLTDTAGGGAKLKVENVNGTAASDLNIAGTATGTTIDGTYEKTLTLTGNDTLASLQQKIADLNFGVQAQIINDGSAVAPYRLSLTAKNSGRSGRVVIDTGSTGLSLNTLVEAQDAAVFVGGAGTAQPLLITSSRNQLSGVVKGVTIDLHNVSNGPVSLSVSRNADNVATQLNTFVGQFNDMVDKLADLTKFDSTTNTRGLLLGDGTIQDLQSKVYQIFSSVVSTGGNYRTLADVGLKLGDGAKLEFDEDKFRAAYATDAQSVQNLFSQTDKGIGYVVENQINKLIDPVNGTITRENKTLDDQTQSFQDRMDTLDSLLAAKKLRLQTQFANMESILAGLQSQGNALASLSGTTTTSTKKTA